MRLRLRVPLLLLLAPAVSIAQAAPAATVADSATPNRKSRAVAVVYSALLPGTGHLYAQDYRRGVVLLTLVGTGLALGAGGENAVTPVGLALIAVPWWYAVLTSSGAVTRYNRRLEVKVGLGTRLEPGSDGGMTPSLRFGLTLSP
jgi:hypothetical protein